MAVTTNSILRLEANGMNLSQTLFCGQSFTWEKRTETLFRGVAGQRAVDAYADGTQIVLSTIRKKEFNAEDDAFWRHYFALETDYSALQKCFCTHEGLASCVALGQGIRVLHQPFFDTLLAFIISQNNNIPRITGIVQRLCREFGTKIEEGVFTFPAPSTLAKCTLEDLAPLRAGFRAKYLLDAAQRVASGEIDEIELRTMPTDMARKKLTAIYGVGTKVADCVLLYSLGRNEVVPMDVWMKRAMAQVFPDGMPAAAQGYEGIAQQYIFCWARENL